MNLKVLMILLIYYGVISGMFLLSEDVFSDFSHNIELNDSNLKPEEIDTGGLFGTGVSFGRFSMFVLFGVGLPSDTPTWFSGLFAIWQTMVLIFSIGWLISSIWNG